MAVPLAAIGLGLSATGLAGGLMSNYSQKKEQERIATINRKLRRERFQFDKDKSRLFREQEQSDAAALQNYLTQNAPTLDYSSVQPQQGLEIPKFDFSDYRFDPSKYQGMTGAVQQTADRQEEATGELAELQGHQPTQMEGGRQSRMNTEEMGRMLEGLKRDAEGMAYTQALGKYQTGTGKKLAQYQSQKAVQDELMKDILQKYQLQRENVMSIAPTVRGQGVDWQNAF